MRRRRSIKRSGYEDNIAKNLDERGIEYEFEPFKLEYYKKVKGGKCWRYENWDEEGEAYQQRNYLPDFVIKRKPLGIEGHGLVQRKELIIEAKGRLVGTDRTKMIAVKQAHPDLDIRFLFYRKEKLKLKRTPYNTDWADANGFPWHIGTEVPEEWL